MTTESQAPAAADPASSPTAALLIIGNEILSGRTQDANLAHIARTLGGLGIPLREVRVVPDLEAEIVTAVNVLRTRYTYLFTTGGIGPTHDDITAASIARAFGVPVVRHPEAQARLERHYAGTGMLSEARLRMADTPAGASLIDNPVSAAPGFQIGNVFVMAGVPVIMQAMLAGLVPRLVGGPPVLSKAVVCGVPEGTLADALRAIQADHPDVDIGSYPAFRQGRVSTSLVLRGTDPARLEAATARVAAMVRALGDEPSVQDGTG
ncbi:competence/damage-inducible protein A [Rhodospirillum centenum]|uniref:Molybdopterin binding domain protein n=1 Tax=Rhodospirillum centenum (strain ATCC 51521 / SW) TaxID=414684 RepID=B6IWS9_RHOCS|nr:competence/damage-inducible protein A [Rhodospirillum centenum]ACJ00753.1 molybdopterin binding domain protein [Rhodospirillum centenum SW]